MDDQAKTYRAFISSSQQDKLWGKRLHGWLEGYRVPPGVTGRLAPGARLAGGFGDEQSVDLCVTQSASASNSVSLRRA